MKTLIALVLLCSLPASAAVLTVSQVLACPAPQWPAPGFCANAAYVPITTPGQTVASVSKTKPIWAHTFSGYTDPTVMLVVCPPGATLSDDHKACTNAQGTDASLLIPKSAIVAPVLPAPVMAAYTITSVSSPDLVVTFSALNAKESQCFTIVSGVRTVTACVPP